MKQWSIKFYDILDGFYIINTTLGQIRIFCHSPALWYWYPDNRHTLDVLDVEYHWRLPLKHINELKDNAKCLAEILQEIIKTEHIPKEIKPTVIEVFVHLYKGKT